MLHEMHCGHMWKLSASRAWAPVMQGKLKENEKLWFCVALCMSTVPSPFQGDEGTAD